MNRRHRLIALPFAALLLIGLAGQALAAPAPSFTTNLTASSSCLLTVTTSWKNAKVASVYLFWYERGYVNPNYPTLTDYVATSQWPGLYGSKKGAVVTFNFGPIGTDTATHAWYGLVQYYDANGAFIAQQYTTDLATACFV